MSASASSFIVEDCKPLARNSLRGFARVRLPSGMILRDVAIHAKNASAWAAPASKPMIDRNGMVMKDQGGKIKYAPIIEFTSKVLRDKFSKAVIDALRAAHPEALQ